MLVMFISLLFSITVGNALYAMESDGDDEVRDETTSISINNLNNDMEMGSTRIEYTPQSTGPITTLADMQRLSGQVLRLNRQKTRGRNRNSFPEQDEFEIPEGATIDPQVFVEYANEEKLITGSEPGWFKRVICRRHKNQFKDASPLLCEEWGKTMLMLYFPNSQREVTIRSGFDGGVDDSLFMGDSDQRINNGVVKVSNSLLTHEPQESDDNEETREKSLKKLLRKAKWENKRLEQKIVLNRALDKYSEEQRKSEESSDQRKGGVFTVVIAVAGVLATYFGASAC